MDDDIQINLRLQRELLDGVDAVVAKRLAERKGSTVTRSDVIRECLYALVDAEVGSKARRR